MCKPFFFLLIFFSVLSQAEVYTWINEQGVRVYGDEPPGDAKKATLPKLQEYKSPEPKAASPSEQKVHQNTDEFAGYHSLEIISPKEDHILQAGQAGNLTVQVHIRPALQPKHEITLLLDGKPVVTGPQLQFDIENIYRGSHLLQARIKYQGKLLIASPKRRIHVQRPSILNRSRT